MMDNDNISDCCQKQQSRPRNEPSGKSVNWLPLLKPPFFLIGLGLSSTLVGFVLLFGPHRRPNIGAVLYFLGFFVFAVSAFALV